MKTTSIEFTSTLMNPVNNLNPNHSVQALYK